MFSFVIYIKSQQTEGQKTKNSPAYNFRMETFRILDILIHPYSGDPYIHTYTCVGIRKCVIYIEW